MQTKRLLMKKSLPVLTVALSMIGMTFDAVANCDVHQCDVCIQKVFNAYEKRWGEISKSIGVRPTDQELSEHYATSTPMNRAYQRNFLDAAAERIKGYDACIRDHGDSCRLENDTLGEVLPNCSDGK